MPLLLSSSDCEGTGRAPHGPRARMFDNVTAVPASTGWCIAGGEAARVQAHEDSQDFATTREDPALAKALARTFRCRRTLEEGRCGSTCELAA